MANTLKFKRGLLAGLPTAAEGEPLFTTDSNDLYIGTSTGNQRFQKYIASGATTQILRGDGSLYSFPLAISSPSNGQVLKFNGTNWVNDSDAGITGSGANGRVAFWTGTNTQSSSTGLLFNGTNALTIDGGSAGYLVGPTGEMLIGEDGAGLYIGGGFGVNPTIPFYYGNNNTTTHIWANGGSQRMRIFSTGNLGIGDTLSDSGQRLQVTGTTLLSDSLRVNGVISQGTAPSASVNFYMIRALSNSASPAAFAASSTINSNATTSAHYYLSQAQTQAASFTVPNIYHYSATQLTIGAGSTVTNQYGFFADSTLIGATNNYGFYGNIPSGTNRWNLFMNGSAPNYINGSLGIGTTSTSGARLSIAGAGTEDRAVAIFKTFTGGTARYGILQFNTVNSDVTATAMNNYSQFVTQATTFTLTNAYHYYNADISVGAGSTITNQYGYFVAPISAATNNYGFYGNVAAATNNWNIYINGNAKNYINGNLLIGSTSDSGEKLQVTGTAKITGATTFSTSINVTSGAAANGIFLNSAGTTALTRLQMGTAVTIFSNNYNAFSPASQDNTAIPSWQIRFGGGSGADFYRLERSPAGSTTMATLFNIDGSGNLTVDTDTFYVDATNNAVGIGTTALNASAVLQTNSTTKGFLPPRMTTTQKNAISSPAAGLVVYDTTLNKLCVYTTAWQTITSI
jgi:hypothetical protein